MIVGLTESADDFPAPPVPAADLKTALDSYLASRDKASVADGAAAEAHGEKDEALEGLVDSLRADLRYAEEAVKHDGEKLAVAELARLLLSAPPARQQLRVHLAQQAVG